MSVDPADIATWLARLREAPDRIAVATDGVASGRLHLPTSDEPWSVNDVLAHVRASADMRERYIVDMLAGERAVLPYVSPRGWIRRTDYLDRPFGESFAAYRAQRAAFVARLEALTVGDWARGALIRDRPETVATYVRSLIDHEGVHCAQIEELLRPEL